MSILILTLLNFPSFAAKKSDFCGKSFCPFLPQKKQYYFGKFTKKKHSSIYAKKQITFFILQTLIFRTRLNEQYNLCGITLNRFFPLYVQCCNLYAGKI